MSAQVVAYRGDDRRLHPYQTVYDDEQAQAARLDCAITRRIPLDRVLVVHPSMLQPAGQEPAAA
jgi:siderophore synthetase component